MLATDGRAFSIVVSSREHSILVWASTNDHHHHLHYHQLFINFISIASWIFYNCAFSKTSNFTDRKTTTKQRFFFIPDGFPNLFSGCKPVNSLIVILSNPLYSNKIKTKNKKQNTKKDESVQSSTIQYNTRKKAPRKIAWIISRYRVDTSSNSPIKRNSISKTIPNYGFHIQI